MSLLTDRPPAPAAGPRSASDLLCDPLRGPTSRAVLAGLQAAALSLLAVAVPVMAAWTAAASGGAAWSEAIRIAADVWLLAHHTGIAVEGGHVGLVPLGLAAVPAYACWAAGHRLAADVGGALPARALAALSVTYALVATVVSLVVATPVARPVSAQAFLGAGVLAGVAAAAGAARARRRAGGRGQLWAAADRLRLSQRARLVLRAGTAAVAVQLLAGSLLVAAAVGLQHDRVLEVHRALEPGVLGGAVLTSAQLAVVPNLVVWASSWAAGPGFQVGQDTLVTPAATVLGPVPALPVLGALPETGAMPAAAGLVVLVPVLAGGLAGWWLRLRRPGMSRGERLLDAASVGAVAGIAMTVLCWLAGGPAGPGRLAEMGPTPWHTGLAVAAEVTLGAVVGISVRWRPPSAAGRWWSYGARLWGAASRESRPSRMLRSQVTRARSVFAPARHRS